MPDRWDNWARIRAGGFWRFTLIYGVLGWGMTVAILWFAVMALIAPIRPTPRNALITLVGFAMGGVIFATLMWFFIDRAYLKERSSGFPVVGKQSTRPKNPELR